jgi:hypothetical protein
MNWPGLFNALRDISIVGFLGYGITLLKQQNELLERGKSLKRSEIDLHKAENERLRSQQAPAIASQLDQMIRTADKLAKEKRKLEELVNALGAESAKVAGKSYLLGVAHASLEAVTVLEKSARVAGDDDVIVSIESIESLSRIAEEALDGKRPEFTELRAFRDWAIRRRSQQSKDGK